MSHSDPFVSEGGQRRRGAFLLEKGHWEDIYGAEISREIADRVAIPVAPGFSPKLEMVGPEHLSAEVLFTGWGTPKLTRDTLDQMPLLRIIFNGGGSIRPFITDEVWARGICVTSAHAANAVPVAQYVVSMVLLSLKQVFAHSEALRKHRMWPGWPVRTGIVGAYGTTVGLVSLGMIGRAVAEQLVRHGLRVIAYDPKVSPEVARKLGVELVSLDDVFAGSEVVSVHTPLLDGTKGLLRRTHFAAMRPRATFINTARGQVVREDELIDVLRERPDLQAVLDVVWPEPPSPESPLYHLPNVMLTPHLAGSLGRECRRHGRTVVEELDRYLAGKPLAWEITQARAAIMA
jgi:phosphoglycerate dehydrogenase-like enzyme